MCLFHSHNGGKDKSMLNAPKNLTVKALDTSALSSWDEVPGADGYILHFYHNKDKAKCFKTRYSQGTQKMILGFTNGEKYKVRVCAFKYENGNEVKGELSEAASFSPISRTLKVPKAIILKAGESQKIKWEYRNTIPDVTFYSTDESVARVDEKGTVTAVRKGVADIVVKMDSQNTAKVSVTVDRDLYRKHNEKAVIMLCGDLMCALNHQRMASAKSYDFSDTFDKIRPHLSSADFSVGVLETTCSDSNPYECEKIRTDKGSPNCNSPASFVSALKNAGFDGLVTANNHNCDTGYEGLSETVELVRKNGLLNFGTLGDNPVVTVIKGIKVAFIACNMISNGLEADCDKGDENCIAKYNSAYFENMVALAKSEGAEYIIAYQHFGKMNSVQVRGVQIRTVTEMANIGADFIIGSHPHVLQSFDVIETDDGRKVPCAYSLGNFLTSMSELKENRESAMIKLTLSRESNGIKAEYSYIPTLATDEKGTVVISAIETPVTEREKEAYDRTASILGNKINVSGKHKVLLQGSVVLRKIFETQSDAVADSDALILSPLSLCSKTYNEQMTDEKITRVRLDIKKNLEEYIKNSKCEYIAIDFYTAVAISLYKLGDSYYTASAGFETSNFYKKHKKEFTLLKAPFDEQLWKESLKTYAGIIGKYFDKEKIILVRLSFSDKRAKYDQLRNGVKRDNLNKRISEMEQYFVSLINPTVIDVSSHYFASGNDDSPSSYEPAFYTHVNKMISRVFNGDSAFYHSQKDDGIFIDRVIKYYDNMTARAYYNWLLSDTDTADVIMKYSSKLFIAKNKERLLTLKNNPFVTLSEVNQLFADDIGAEELIKTAKAIDLLLKGDISQPYDSYSVIFKNELNAVRLMSKLLTEKTGIRTEKHNCELLFMLKDDEEKLNEYKNNLTEISVDIWGSCVSREAVNYNPELISVNKYIFKQPPLLAFEKEIPHIVPESSMCFSGNAWRRRTIKEAFAHEGTRTLTGSKSKWLIVDFYDLICNMMLFKDGLFEVDDFVMRTAFFKEISKDCKKTYLFKEKDTAFCDNAIKQFAQFVKKRYGSNIILIKLSLKDKYITLDNEMADLRDDGTFAEKKEFVERYEKIFYELTDCYVIDVAKHFYADDSFSLGGAHIVHYEKEFYSCCAKHITEILKGSTEKYYSDIDKNYILLRDLKLKK